MAATSSIDFDQINSCMVGCGHSRLDQQNTPERYHRTIDLILIDVVAECLVTAQSSEQYLALSYVWGDTDLSRTTRATLEALQNPGSLTGHAKLPRVVQDAMAVVRQLNYRYLWVDCLCIVQDSPDKHMHIASMDIIYAQASLTLVALDGKNADTPLPGVAELSRLPVVNYQQLKDDSYISEPPYTLSSYMSGSVYETRGWTLQEWAVSRRLLYFSAQQVIYECDHCGLSYEYLERSDDTFYTGSYLIGTRISQLLHGTQDLMSTIRLDHVFRLDGVGDDMFSSFPSLLPPKASSTRKSHLTRRKQLLAAAEIRYFPEKRVSLQEINSGSSVPESIRPILRSISSLQANDKKKIFLPASIDKLEWQPLSVSSSGFVILSLYRDVVESYTARKLSFSRDVLAAFSGLSAIFAAKDESGPFINGLPKNYLTSALLWVGQTGLNRRLDEQKMPFLPSYTWAGWNGSVSYYCLTRSAELNMADLIEDSQSPTASFYGLCMDCNLYIHSTGVDAKANISHQIFSIFEDSPPCGVLFGTSISEKALGDYILVAVGSDENKFAELDLAVHCGLWFPRNPHRIYSRRFLVVLLLQRRIDGHSERVGVGKVDATVFFSAMPASVRKVHLVDEAKRGPVKSLQRCTDCSRPKPSCIYLT